MIPCRLIFCAKITKHQISGFECPSTSICVHMMVISHQSMWSRRFSCSVIEMEDREMDRTNIAESRNQLRSACEDLEALRAIVQVVEAQKDWPNEREMLLVLSRSLAPIIKDIQGCIDSISKELNRTGDV